MRSSGVDHHLCHLSATDAIARFRDGTLSPVELLDALIERIDASEPALNAVCDRRFDEARDEAIASTARYAAGAATLPLDGVPIAMKEEHPMLGRSWAQGSLTHEHDVAPLDHPIVERIQAAGGIVHIRTTTPEFCCAGFTESRLWGITRNPWNLDVSPGGSSGGSGAALAAGYSPLASGSDIGGSIRIPASLCGVVGFKPPYGRVPALAPFNLDQYCHDGPMARTVADTALLQNVIAGRHPVDVVSLPNPPVVPVAALRGVAGMRVALCLHLGDFPIEPEVEANTRAVAASLVDAGAIVQEVELPWRYVDILDAAKAHFGTIFGPYVAQQRKLHPDMLTDYAIRFAEDMATGPAFVDGLEIEGQIWLALGELFERFDALLCPTLGTRGFDVGEHYVDRPLTVAGVDLSSHLLGCLTLPFNIASRCPVLSMPSGWADNGVPTGVQLVGRTYADEVVFELGHALEAAGHGWTRAPDSGSFVM